MMQAVVLVSCLLVSAIQPEVVAETDAGIVSVADVERELEFMTAKERRYRDEMGISSEQTRRDVIERIALRVIAVKEASVDGLDRDPATVERLRKAGRLWLTGVWRNNRWGLEESRLPSEAVVRRELEGTVPTPPDRIRLSHIFLPATTDEARDEAQALMQGWRAEARDLETFKRLAQRHSASQDRDRGGRMGWVQRGFLDPGIEEALFALESGSVSSPMYFDGGMHMFFVELVEVDRAPRLEAHVKAEMDRRFRELTESRRAELLGQARKKLEVRIERRDASQWPDLRVGRQMVSGSVLEAKAGSTADVNRRVQGWIEDELLFQSALESDWMTSHQRARLKDLAAQGLHDAAAARWVSEHMRQPSQESVRRLIEAEPQRFRHRLRLEVRAAATSLDGDVSPRLIARRLAETVENLDAGRLTWDGAVKALPPATEVSHLPPATNLEVAGVLGPRVFKEIARAGPGAVRGPIQSKGRLWVIQVVDRIEPSPLEDREAEAKARKILLSRQAARLGGEFGDRRLEDHHFHLTDLGRSMTGDDSDAVVLKEHQ